MILGFSDTLGPDLTHREHLFQRLLLGLWGARIGDQIAEIFQLQPHQDSFRPNPHLKALSKVTFLPDWKPGGFLLRLRRVGLGVILRLGSGKEGEPAQS